MDENAASNYLFTLRWRPNGYNLICAIHNLEKKKREEKKHMRKYKCGKGDNKCSIILYKIKHLQQHISFVLSSSFQNTPKGYVCPRRQEVLIAGIREGGDSVANGHVFPNPICEKINVNQSFNKASPLSLTLQDLPFYAWPTTFCQKHNFKHNWSGNEKHITGLEIKYNDDSLKADRCSAPISYLPLNMGTGVAVNIQSK